AAARCTAPLWSRCSPSTAGPHRAGSSPSPAGCSSRCSCSPCSPRPSGTPSSSASPPAPRVLTVIDLERLATHALSLDGVRERASGGRRGWYWSGRLVARQEDDESVVVRCAFDLRERMLVAHPETFSVPPRLESHQK